MYQLCFVLQSASQTAFFKSVEVNQVDVSGVLQFQIQHTRTSQRIKSCVTGSFNQCTKIAMADIYVKFMQLGFDLPGTFLGLYNRSAMQQPCGTI